MKVNLNFEVLVECEVEYADDLGKDLATFLRESFFNGEDVIDVNYKGHELNKN